MDNSLWAELRKQASRKDTRFDRYIQRGKELEHATERRIRTNVLGNESSSCGQSL